MLQKILTALPNIFAAALLLVVAYFVARVVAGLTSNVLTGVGFNDILAKLGVGQPVLTGQRTPAAVVGNLALVAIMLFASIEAARLLTFDALALLIADFLRFAGHVILGLVIFGFGLFLAKVAADAIRTSQSANAAFLALASRVAILILAGAMALRQMELANDIVNIAFGLLLGAVAVAVALAFGLGGRDLAAKTLAEWQQSLRTKKG